MSEAYSTLLTQTGMWMKLLTYTVKFPIYFSSNSTTESSATHNLIPKQGGIKETNE